MILGIDEVGRGCWAGPLVVGAVVLGDRAIEGLTDSKILTKKRREHFAEILHKKAQAVGLGWVSASELDEIGMSESLRLATRRAVKEVQAKGVFFDEVIIDGTINFLSNTALSRYVTTLKKADLLIASVSAASIVAKVARDNYMNEQAKLYPIYGFESNVGYGAEFHRVAIAEHGVSPLHRLSFKPLAKYANKRTSAQPASKTAITTKNIGDSGEESACHYLRNCGHDILERNWRTKWCEIDIISRKNQKLYFVEVKYRKNASHGSGLEAITPKKLKQMKFASELYIKTYKLHATERQLVVMSVSGDPAAVEMFLEIA